jgi:anti-sigma regulatory factor (Ser/Thr protein kinase)
MDEPRNQWTAGPVTLETPAGISSLAGIREFVGDACRRLAAPPDAVIDLVQAVDEAVTNVTLHGYKDYPGPVEITVARDGDRLTVTIRDEAPPFDPTGFGPPDLSKPLQERSSGGLGIHLMRFFTDAMIYRCLPGGGNELILVKHAPVASFSPLGSHG